MTNKAIVSRFHASQEFYSDERCYITEIHNCDTDPDCSIVRVRVEPNVSTQLHALNGTEERYVVLAGEGLIRAGTPEEIPIAPLDVVFVPADTPQSVTNTGSADLIMLCVCTPRFTQSVYMNKEAQD